MSTEMNAVAARGVTRVLKGIPTSDGAGVKLTRVIGQPQLSELDPFLLLDEFGTDKPRDYIAGFPEHPHRGFETVTYMLDGRMRHKDNHGHEGVLVPGSVQWMTAGRGIVHSEMPEQEEGRMRGFQLWINLPAREKMTAPKYQEFAPQSIPIANPAAGAEVRVIAGQVGEVAGPIRQPATDPTYLDVQLEAGVTFSHALPPGHAAFVYVYEGSVRIGSGPLAVTVNAHGRRGGACEPRHPHRREAVAGAGGEVRAVRDEHARGDRQGRRGFSGWKVLIPPFGGSNPSTPWRPCSEL
jgi:redox-sensitive bicupin YhaK (pirin superfamily)